MMPTLGKLVSPKNGMIGVQNAWARTSHVFSLDYCTLKYLNDLNQRTRTTQLNIAHNSALTKPEKECKNTGVHLPEPSWAPSEISRALLCDHFRATQGSFQQASWSRKGIHVPLSINSKEHFLSPKFAKTIFQNRTEFSPSQQL